jgi:hypothetical protein
MTLLDPSMSKVSWRIHDPSPASSICAAYFPCFFAIRSSQSSVAGAARASSQPAGAPAASSRSPGGPPPST